MKKFILIVLFPFFVSGQEIKNVHIIDPAGKWYFGAEVGLNSITSNNVGQSNKSLQGGFLVEYYTARHWSLTSRIKYFKTGLSFLDAASQSTGTSSSGFGPSFIGIFDRSATYTEFNGAVLTVPLNIKWEFRIRNNFNGNINLGGNYNFETQSNYFYTDTRKYGNFDSREYFSSNFGLGFGYFINENSAVFLNFEGYTGGVKNRISRLIFDRVLTNTNSLINFGYKYSFTK